MFVTKPTLNSRKLVLAILLVSSLMLLHSVRAQTLVEEADAGYLEHGVVGCDLKTGKLLWKHTLARGYDEHSAWPLYREPYLWTSAPFQSGSRLWELTDGDLPTCHEVWHSELMSNDVSSSVLVDETIYGFDLAEAQSKAHRASRGSFRAIDWSTGKERWHNGEPKTRRATDFETNRSQKVRSWLGVPSTRPRTAVCSQPLPSRLSVCR